MKNEIFISFLTALGKYQITTYLCWVAVEKLDEVEVFIRDCYC